MQKIVTHLWFDNNAEEAVNFYTSIFKDSKVTARSHYGKEMAKASGQQEGSVMTIVFEMNGQEFFAINGGPMFKFTPAISLLVYCKDQKEIDNYYDKLSEGGSKDPCGWLTDRYGLSWQIVPEDIQKMALDKNPDKAERMFKEMVTMKKLDLAKLKSAWDGKADLTV